MKNLLMSIGTVIRTERYRQGLSLKDVAGRGYLSFSFLAEVERGESNPTFPMLEAIAKGLGLTVGDLLELAIKGPEEVGSMYLYQTKNDKLHALQNHHLTRCGSRTRLLGFRSDIYDYELGDFRDVRAEDITCWRCLELMERSRELLLEEVE